MATKYKIDGIKLDGAEIQIYDDFLREAPLITETPVDIDPPFITILAPAAGQEFTTADDVDVTGTAYDDFQVAKVETSMDGGSWIEATNTSGGASIDSWISAYPDLANGAHSVKARAVDTAGLMSAEAEVNFTVNIPPPVDKTKPDMAITSHTNNQEIKNAKVGMIIEVKGTSADNSGGSGLKSVVATIREPLPSNTGQPYMPATITGSNWAVKLTVGNLKYTRIVAKATDNAGNYRTGNVVVVYKAAMSYDAMWKIDSGGSTYSAWTGSGTMISQGSNGVTVFMAALNYLKTRSGPQVLNFEGFCPVQSTPVNLSVVPDLLIDGGEGGKETSGFRCAVAGAKVLVKSNPTKLTLKNFAVDGKMISGKIVDFPNAGDLTMDSLKLIGHNDPYPGVYIEEVQKALIERCFIGDSAGRGDAFAIGGYNVIFQKNEMTRKFMTGGGFTSGGLADSKVLDNNFHDMKSYSATSLENFHVRADGVHSFKNIEIARNKYTDLLDGNAISSLGYADTKLAPKGTSHSLNIHHNVLERVHGGIRMNASDGQVNVVTYNSDISDNTLTDTAGIMAGPLKTCTLNNNTVNRTANWRGYGIWIHKGSDDVRMNGNKLTNIAKSPYYYATSTNIYIDGVKKA